MSLCIFWSRPLAQFFHSSSKLSPPPGVGVEHKSSYLGKAWLSVFWGGEEGPKWPKMAFLEVFFVSPGFGLLCLFSAPQLILPQPPRVGGPARPFSQLASFSSQPAGPGCFRNSLVWTSCHLLSLTRPQFIVPKSPKATPTCHG